MVPFLESVAFYISTVTKPQEMFYITHATVYGMAELVKQQSRAQLTLPRGANVMNPAQARGVLIWDFVVNVNLLRY